MEFRAPDLNKLTTEHSIMIIAELVLKCLWWYQLQMKHQFEAIKEIILPLLLVWTASKG